MELHKTIFHRTVGHVLRIAAGSILLLIGVLGLILPLLPGWPFIISGILLLWPKSRVATWLRRWLVRIRAWFRKRKGLAKTGGPLPPSPGERRSPLNTAPENHAVRRR